MRRSQWTRRYMPWRQIRSWQCIRCGRCCSEFTINLQFYDYARLSQYYPQTVALDSLGNPYIKRVHGKCTFQDAAGFCTLQKIGLKPFICKVWPFKVYDHPTGQYYRQAYFQHQNKDYYVYLNPLYMLCPGINHGTSRHLPLTLAEIVEIHRNRLAPQKYTTAPTQHLPYQRFR